MKRREILKTGMVIAGGIAASVFSGCSNNKIHNENYKVQSKSFSITPKQTEIYKISAPMPFDYKLIDRICELNQIYKKTKVTTLYNSIPNPLAGQLLHFQSPRGENGNIKSFNDFAKYVKYAKKQGFNFVYTLNSPKTFLDAEFKEKSKVLHKLLDNLEKIECTNLKVANTQLLNFLRDTYPQFEISASTSFEFHTLKQYTNLLEKYPSIKSINLTLDENRNFRLLKSLKEKFPKVEIELMANEACLYGCPARIAHPCSGVDFCEYINEIKKQGLLFVCQSRHIYPWDLEYYSAMGINNFKIMKGSRANITKLDFLETYLDVIENNGCNYTVSDYFEKYLFKQKSPEIKNKNILLCNIKEYLPDMKYFVENGHRCSDDCGVNCRYCYKCVEKLAKILS